MSLAEELPVLDLEGPPVTGVVRNRQRSRRPRAVRSQTTSRISHRALAAGRDEFPIDEDLGVERPTTRADCIDGVRPCPFVSCRFNLYLDVTPCGGLKLNFPDLEPDEMRQSCALDVAAQGGSTLEEVGAATNLTRERVRQVEVKGLSKLKWRLPILRDEQPRRRDFTDADVEKLVADDDE